MKTFVFVLLLTSLGLNAICAYAVLGRHRVNSAAVAVGPTDAKPTVAASRAAVPPLTQEYWANLKSADLPALVAQLRAAGYPRDVLKAIVGAALGEEFMARRRALLPDEEKQPFWKGVQSDPKISLEMSKLGREHARIMRNLLGEDDRTDLFTEFQERRQFGAMSADKVDQVRQLVRDYVEKRNDLVFGTIGPAERAKMAAWEKEQHEALAKILSPQELEEYDLRGSRVANQLREELSAFQPTEEEFRTLYKLRAAQDSQMGELYGPSTPEQMRQRAEAKRQLNEQVKLAFGNQRYEEYARATDYNYRETTKLVQRLDLPADVANQVWAAKAEAQQTYQAILRETASAPDERTARLAAASAQAQGKFTTLLTARGFEAYKQYGGSWLQVFEPRAEQGH